MKKHRNKESQRNFIPCKYRDIIYRDMKGKIMVWRSSSDLNLQRKKAKWEKGFCTKVQSKGIIHSYLISNDFAFIDQCLPEDVKILNPIHVFFLSIQKRIYTLYSNLKIKLTKKVDQGIIHKISYYLENRIFELEIESEKKNCSINFALRIEELKKFEKKFRQYVDEERKNL